MIKRLSVAIIVIMFLITSTTIADASVISSKNQPPKADIYKEGIYHFSQSSGNKMTLQLETPNEPMILIIIENESRALKYYVEFTKDSPKIEITSTKPISEHTTVILGKGELAFTISKFRNDFIF